MCMKEDMYLIAYSVAAAAELDAEWTRAINNKDFEYANRITALRTRISTAADGRVALQEEK